MKQISQYLNGHFFILFGLIFSLQSCQKSKQQLMEKEELSGIMKECNSKQKCMREKLKQSSKVIAADVVLEDFKPNSNSMLEMKNYKTYTAKLPRGPLAKIFVENKYEKELKQKVLKKEQIKIAMVTGIVFLYLPDDSQDTWKSKVYNPLLEKLTSLSEITEKKI
jgi:hypothetical protein